MTIEAINEGIIDGLFMVAGLSVYACALYFYECLKWKKKKKQMIEKFINKNDKKPKKNVTLLNKSNYEYKD